MPGVLLIGFGLWLILDRMHLNAEFDIILPVLGGVAGIFLLFEAFRLKSESSIFWGTSILLVSLFFALRNSGAIMYLYPDEYWPIFPLALGLGFLSKFLMRPSRWGVLIPGVILLMVGVTGALEISGLWYDGWSSMWSYFWPILIILIGVGILFNSFRQQKKSEIED